MADQVVNLGLVGLPNPPALGNVQPFSSARRLHVHQMLRAQDRPIAGGRRILAYYSWDGEYDHPFGHIEMSDGDTAGVNETSPDATCGPYPAADTSRTLGEWDGVPITPGCALMIHVTHLTSGATFNQDGVDSGAPQTYTSTGSSGQLKATVVWDDQAVTESIVSEIDLAQGTTAPYRIEDAEGAAWLAMRERSAFNAPAGVLFDPAEVAQWSAPGVTVSITIEAIGCARIVDVAIYEVPVKYGLTDADPAGPAHVYAENESPRGQFPDEYPTEGANSGDKRYGATHTIAVAAAQEMQLGPSLWCFSSARERFADRGWAASSDPDPETITGTTETVLGAGAVASTSPRIDVGTLAYGRRFAQSDPVEVMTEGGSCRIAFGVYWSVSAGTGTLRLESADYSKAEVTTTSTSYGWSKATTDLACGGHPLDGMTAVVSGENSGSNDTRVRYAWCSYWPA